MTVAPRALPAAAGAFAVAAAAVLGTQAVEQPALALAAPLAALWAVSMLRMPDAATLLVLAVVYSNAAVVAVKFHGVPYVAGMGVSLLLVLPLAYHLGVRGERLVVPPALPWLAGFGAVLAVGSVFASNAGAARTELITFAVEGLSLYVLVVNVVRTRELLRRVVWLLLGVGTVLGGLSLFQQLTGSFDNDFLGFAQVSDGAFQTDDSELRETMQSRLAGPIGEQNRYAQVMLVLVPLGIMVAMFERSPRGRAAAAVATLLISAGVLLTFSRGAGLGFAAVLLLMAFLRYIRLYQLVLVVAGVVLLINVVPAYKQRIATLEALQGASASESGLREADSSVRSRTTELLAAVHVYLDHPVIGVGPGNYRDYYRDYAEEVGVGAVKSERRQSHSLYLGLAAETGTLGLLCFGGLVAVTMRGLARTRRRFARSDPELAAIATGLLLGVCAYLVTGLFLHMAYARYFWLLVALGAAVTAIAERASQPTRSGGSEPPARAVPELAAPA